MSKKLNLLILAGVVAATSAGVTATLTTAKSSDATLTNTATNTSEVSTLLDETIYVFTEANGNVRRIISSDWTKSALGTDQYTKVEKADKSTPISLNVKYTLDDKEISAADLTGKSGKVTIEYSYTNNQKINGYYVPYAVMTGLILDNNNFSNVEVSGARLMNDGSRTVIAGITLPGMQENLGISKDTFDIPSSFTITADAKDFKLGMTMSIATTEIFKDIDTFSLNSIDELSGQLSKLTDSMEQLISGSSKLYDGLAELNDKSSTLITGINQLAAGSVELSSGLASADAGVATLQDGVSQLSAGLSQLTANNNALGTGASQTFDSLIKNAHDLIEAKINATTYSTALSQFASAVSQYTAAGAATPAEVIAQLPTEAITIPNFTQTTYATILDNLSTTYPTSATDFQTAKAQLDYYRDNFLAGINNYTAGAAEISAALKEQILPGINDLKTGTTELYNGSITLSDGLSELESNTPALSSGISQLKNGSGNLRDGIVKLNNEGIQKLVNAYGNLTDFTSRLKSIINIAKNTTSTKYIYRVDEVK